MLRCRVYYAATRFLVLLESQQLKPVATGMQTSEQLPSFTDTPAGFMTEASALDAVENEPLLEQLLEVLLQAVAAYSLRHADCNSLFLQCCTTGSHLHQLLTNLPACALIEPLHQRNCCFPCIR